MNIKAIRGFRDILTKESKTFRTIETTASRVFATFGYEEIKTPIAEKTALFTRTIGETTDIVEKEMYTFPDRKDESLTLRPEGTASVVRAFIEHKLYNEKHVTKLFCSGPMFRYERPQKGRYRQFTQIGAEVFGEQNPEIDAEVLEMLVTFFKELKIKDIELEINTLGCKNCRDEYKKELLEFLLKIEDNLCANCTRRIKENPLRALDCKVPDCDSATEKAPSIIDHVCNTCTECSTHYKAVKDSLTKRQISYKENKRMVRGLDYYTKTTFEVTYKTSEEGLGSQNSVAAGGRYDGLVENLGGPKTPAIGFAIGIDRLAIILENIEKDKQSDLIAFVPLGDRAINESYGMVKKLRDSGLAVECIYSGKDIKAKMKKANKASASYAILLGDNELDNNEVTLKIMAKGEQKTLKFDDCLRELLFEKNKSN